MRRIRDTILGLALEKETVHVISTHASQVGINKKIE